LEAGFIMFGPDPVAKHQELEFIMMFDSNSKLLMFLNELFCPSSNFNYPPFQFWQFHLQRPA
jgi:hypothetical protein